MQRCIWTKALILTCSKTQSKCATRSLLNYMPTLTPIIRVPHRRFLFPIAVFIVSILDWYMHDDSLQDLDGEYSASLRRRDAGSLSLILVESLERILTAGGLLRPQ